MPERRVTRLLSAALASVALLAGVWVAYHSSDLKSPPWRDRLPLFFPFYTAVDQSGRAYTSDSATSRLVALDRDGSLRWTLDGRKYSGGFYNAVGLAIDSHDDLYVTNWLPMVAQNALAQELQIQRYNSLGQLMGTVYRLENTSHSEDFPGYFSFTIQKDVLYILHGDGTRYDLFQVPAAGGTPTLVRTVNAPTDFVSIANTPDGTLAGAARNGTLWRAAPGQDWKLSPVPGVAKPWDLKFHPDGSLLVLDLLGGTIKKLGLDGSLEIVLDSKQTGGTFSDTFSLAPNGTLVIADKERQRLLVSPFAREYRAYEGASLNSGTVAGHWVTYVSLVVGSLCALAALVLFYLFVVKRRVPLMVIQVGLFVPIIIAAQAITFGQVYDGLYSRYKAEVRNTLLNAAQLVARTLSPQDLLALKNPADLDSEAYQRLKKAVLSLRTTGRETGAFSYIALYRNLGGHVHIVLTGSGVYGVNYPYPIFPAQAMGLFSAPGVQTADYSDDYGEYSGGFASVAGPAGSPVGVVEVGLYADLVKEVENSYFASARLFSAVSGGIFVVILFIITLLLIRSLNTLRRITRDIALRNIELPTELKSHDGIGQLGGDFGTMPRKLKGYFDEITAHAATSARFVPRDFINLLEVEDLTKVKAGNHANREMTVLFSSIVNFRKITGSMSSQGVVNYLNAYLARVAPHIRDNRGFVDKYFGGTYLALFPRTPRDALTTFKLVNRHLANQNRQRVRSGSGGLFLSFGIHKAPLMLGIVGEEQRLEGTVVSDAVNLTRHLNDWCRLYHVPCLATFQTLEQAGAFPFRKIDHVIVKGRSEPLLICEPLDELDPEKAVLMDYLKAYDEAFSAFEKGDLKTASDGFEFLKARAPKDTVIQQHAARCRQILETGRPEVWNPAVQFHEK